MDKEPPERFTLAETPIRDSFAEAVRKGLTSRPRSLPPRWFYDARGTELFERICALPEYYVTRTETAVLERCAREIPAASTVIEFGCGMATKTRLLLDAFFRARERITYVPVDISRRALEESAPPMLSAYPGLTIRAIQAEYERAHELPNGEDGLVLFLGSNIGNFNHDEAVRFLSALRGRRVLVGFDMQKDADVLHAAYNDAQGVTAEFNLNLLARINRELGGSFDLAQWEHRAFYNAPKSRIEMHVVSKRPQQARAAGTTFVFDEAEAVHTENSYKFSMAQIGDIARRSGFRIAQAWTDDSGWFSLVLMS